MSDEEFLEYIALGFYTGFDETNSVKLEDGRVLLPGIYDEEKLALYFLDEVNPLEDIYMMSDVNVLGHAMTEKTGGSFTEQGYVFEVRETRKKEQMPEAKGKYGDMSMGDICRELNRHPETTHLVSWFGDYALYEPALNVSDEEIYKAYDKLLQREKTLGNETAEEQEYEMER
ncbi:MAG: hypothetical protein NC428_07595 [Clostridium sp.]|nr:hypothetical protein [Clostridium sp.]